MRTLETCSGTPEVSGLPAEETFVQSWKRVRTLATFLGTSKVSGLPAEETFV